MLFDCLWHFNFSTLNCVFQNILYILKVTFFFHPFRNRWNIQPSGRGNVGRAGLVFGSVGDDTNASFRQRHGIQQGKKEKRFSSSSPTSVTLFITSFLRLKRNVRHRVWVGVCRVCFLFFHPLHGIWRIIVGDVVKFQCLCHLLASDWWWKLS